MFRSTANRSFCRFSSRAKLFWWYIFDFFGVQVLTGCHIFLLCLWKLSLCCFWLHWLLALIDCSKSARVRARCRPPELEFCSHLSGVCLALAGRVRTWRRCRWPQLYHVSLCFCLYFACVSLVSGLFRLLFCCAADNFFALLELFSISCWFGICEEGHQKKEASEKEKSRPAGGKEEAGFLLQLVWELGKSVHCKLLSLQAWAWKTLKKESWHTPRPKGAWKSVAWSLLWLAGTFELEAWDV